MDACLSDWTTKRGIRNEVSEDTDTACSVIYSIQKMKLNFLLCPSLIKADMFS